MSNENRESLSEQQLLEKVTEHIAKLAASTVSDVQETLSAMADETERPAFSIGLLVYWMLKEDITQPASTAFLEFVQAKQEYPNESLRLREQQL